MKEQKINTIVIPKNCDIEDFLDTSDKDYFDEPPTYSEEVKITFERNDSDK